eukprot:4168897-Lingulodinium_polyedra.AAC.1
MCSCEATCLEPAFRARAREAQVWADRLCKAWAIVLKAAFHGWDQRKIRAQLEKIWSGDEAAPTSLQLVDFEG